MNRPIHSANLPSGGGSVTAVTAVTPVIDSTAVIDKSPHERRMHAAYVRKANECRDLKKRVATIPGLLEQMGKMAVELAEAKASRDDYERQIMERISGGK